MSKYRKAIVAVAGVLVVLGNVLSDGSLTLEEGVLLATSALAAFGVYQVPNTPSP